MDFYTKFNEAKSLAASITDWENAEFNWNKAFIAAVCAPLGGGKSSAFKQFCRGILNRFSRNTDVVCE